MWNLKKARPDPKMRESPLSQDLCSETRGKNSFFRVRVRVRTATGLGQQTLRRRDSADSETTGLGRHLYGDRTRPTLVQRRDSADTCTATGLGRQLYGGLMCLYGCGLFVGGGEPGEPAGRANPAKRTCGRGEPGEPAGGAEPGLSPVAPATRQHPAAPGSLGASAGSADQLRRREGRYPAAPGSTRQHPGSTPAAPRQPGSTWQHH